VGRYCGVVAREGVQVEFFDLVGGAALFSYEVFEIGVVGGGRAGAKGWVRHGEGVRFGFFGFELI
jgi:hypothetical protein